MITLLIRTDNPQAELHLYRDSEQLDEMVWHAHRTLSDTILNNIHELLSKHQLTLHDINKIGVYKGPGSFTGLRIGITTANSLAYAMFVPITSGSGAEWQKQCLDKSTDENNVIPEYGADPHITKQKK